MFEQRQHRSRLLWETGVSHLQPSFRGGKICCLVKIVTQACQGPAGGAGEVVLVVTFWGVATLQALGGVDTAEQWHPTYDTRWAVASRL